MIVEGLFDADNQGHSRVCGRKMLSFKARSCVAGGRTVGRRGPSARTACLTSWLGPRWQRNCRHECPPQLWPSPDVDAHQALTYVPRQRRGRQLLSVNRCTGNVLLSVSRSVGHGLLSVSRSVGHGLLSVSRSVGHGLLSVSRSVGHGLLSVSRSVGHGLLSVSRSVGHGLLSLSLIHI